MTIFEQLLKGPFSKQYEVDGITVIDLDFNKHSEYFGLIDEECILSIKHPELFGKENIQALFPSLSLSYGRFTLACNLMGNRLHVYSRPRDEFYRDEAFEEAISRKCDFLIMEDLS